ALNCFDAGSCDSPVELFLADLFVAIRALRGTDGFADRADLALAGLREGVLGDFLRVFLGIRLPFVAFSGSTVVQGRFYPWTGVEAQGWANLMRSEYGQKELDIPPVCFECVSWVR